MHVILCMSQQTISKHMWPYSKVARSLECLESCCWMPAEKRHLCDLQSPPTNSVFDQPTKHPTHSRPLSRHLSPSNLSLYRQYFYHFIRDYKLSSSIRSHLSNHHTICPSYGQKYGDKQHFNHAFKPRGRTTSQEYSRCPRSHPQRSKRDSPCSRLLERDPQLAELALC